MLSSQAQHWLKAAGAKVVMGEGGQEAVCDISPLLSYAGEGLEDFAGKEIKLPFVLHT